LIEWKVSETSPQEKYQNNVNELMEFASVAMPFRHSLLATLAESFQRRSE